jgi:hypothetical protein
MAPSERHQVVSTRTTKRLDHIQVIPAGAINKQVRAAYLGI